MGEAGWVEAVEGGGREGVGQGRWGESCGGACSS